MPTPVQEVSVGDMYGSSVPFQVLLINVVIILRVDWRKGRVAHTPWRGLLPLCFQSSQDEAPLGTEEPSGSELGLWSQPV